jgi:HTH-type transcriptional regulator / antitoxin HigA
MPDGSFAPQWYSKPGSTLLALMQKQGVSVDEMVQRIGCDHAFFRGVVAGSIAIDAKLAGTLAKSIGGSAAFWTKRQTQFDNSLDRVMASLSVSKASEWLKLLPIQEMKKLGWIKSGPDKSSALRACLSYYDVADFEEWESNYEAVDHQFSFRSSQTFQSKIGALSAWLRQAEIQASFSHCAPWNLQTFRTLFPKIKALTRIKEPSVFVPKLRRLCAEAGVAIVFIKAPTGCKASGATRFLSSSKAMIAMSFRYLSDDHFWFTFFHEAAHLILHGEEAVFIEEDKGEITIKEKEANTFAAQTLIPMQKREEFLELRSRSHAVIRFAVSLGISPGIVVGQMQHERLIGPGQLNHLKRRYDWKELSDVLL